MGGEGTRAAHHGCRTSTDGSAAHILSRVRRFRTLLGKFSTIFNLGLGATLDTDCVHELYAPHVSSQTMHREAELYSNHFSASHPKCRSFRRCAIGGAHYFANHELTTSRHDQYSACILEYASFLKFMALLFNTDRMLEHVFWGSRRIKVRGQVSKGRRKCVLGRLSSSIVIISCAS